MRKKDTYTKYIDISVSFVLNIGRKTCDKITILDLTQEGRV